MKCPNCGREASLVGLPAGPYPAAYRCYGCPRSPWSEFNFSARGPDADAECARARATSKANAEAYRATRCAGEEGGSNG